MLNKNRKINKHTMWRQARRRMKYKPRAEHCYWCKVRLVDYPANMRPQSDDMRTIDHVIPLSYHGTNDLENLVWACLGCNTARGYMPIDQVIRMNEAKLKELK